MSDAESSLSEDESEVLVYVEFEGFVDSSTFKNEKLKLDIVGIDTEHPIMQINGKFYEGTFRDAVGTYMFFEKDDSPIIDDPIFDIPPTLKYFAKTRKLLKMDRVFAMQRTEVLGDSDHAYCVPNMDTIKEAGVAPKYQDDALQFWTKMRDDRMQALTTYLEKQQIREQKRLDGVELDSESDDDSPFAMYKPKKDKQTENVPRHPKIKSAISNQSQIIPEMEDTDISNILEKIMELEPNTKAGQDCSKKSTKKLTVIDPGPSTSKHCDPDMPLLTCKKRRKTAVKVIPKPKSKDVFKKPNKRAPKSKKSIKTLPQANDTDESLQIDTLKIQTELDLNDMESLSVLEVMEKAADKDTDSTVDEGNQSPKNVCVVSRKLKKQAKREAKMKEISERLKIHKDELLKTNNSSNIPHISKTKDI